MIGMMNGGVDVPDEYYRPHTKDKSHKHLAQLYARKKMLREKITYTKDGRMLVDGQLTRASEILTAPEMWEEMMVRVMCRAVCESYLKTPAPPKRRFSDYLLPWRRRAPSGHAAATAVANAATAVREAAARKESISSEKSFTTTIKNAVSDSKLATLLNNDNVNAKTKPSAILSNGKIFCDEQETESQRSIPSKRTSVAMKQKNQKSKNSVNPPSQQQNKFITAIGSKLCARVAKNTSQKNLATKSNNVTTSQPLKGVTLTAKNGTVLRGNVDVVITPPASSTKSTNNAGRPKSHNEEVTNALVNKITSKIARSSSSCSGTSTNNSVSSTPVLNGSRAPNNNRLTAAAAGKSSSRPVSVPNSSRLVDEAARKISASSSHKALSVALDNERSPKPGPRRPLHSGTTTNTNTASSKLKFIPAAPKFFKSSTTAGTGPTVNSFTCQRRVKKVR